MTDKHKRSEDSSYGEAKQQQDPEKTWPCGSVEEDGILHNLTEFTRPEHGFRTVQ